MKEIFNEYGQLLSERLLLGRRVKEDESRYTFFLAALKSGIYKHTDIYLESPHPTFPNMEIDTMLESKDGLPMYIFEFKFDQQPPNATLVRLNCAGAIFDDLLRLAHVNFTCPTCKLFVYVTDSKMHNYFRKPRNGFGQFYSSDRGNPFYIKDDFWIDKPTTFMNAIKTDQSIPFSTSLCFAQDLPNNYFLRIFEVNTWDIQPV